MDYGRARIGLAIADEEAGLARPIGTLVRKNRNEDMRRLREIVREHGVKQIVLGLPLNMDGTKGEMAAEAERFAERVRKQIGVPVELVDERLTSWEAGQLLRKKGKRFQRRDAESAEKRPRGKDRGSSVDAMAAVLILREYLEHRQIPREHS